MSETAVVKVEEKKILTTEKNTKELAISDAVQVLMKSGMVKDGETAGKLLAKISFGRDLGISDVAAVNGITFSPNGTLVMSAALMLSLIKRSGKYRMEYKQRSDKVCEIQMYEKVDGQWFSCGVPCKYTWEDAVRANLTTKQTYRLFPTQMLTARCISDCFKTHCSDVVSCPVYTPEEIPDSGYVTNPETGDIVDEAEYTPKKPTPTVTVSGGVSKRQQFDTLVAETGADVKQFLTEYKVKSVDDLNESQLNAAVNLLKIRKASK